MKVCVYRPGALGDLIVTGPAIQAMCNRWPEISLTLIASPAWRALAGQLTFLSAEDRALLPLFMGNPPARGGWLPEGGFDLALLFLQNSDPLLEQGFQSVASRVLTLRSRPPEGYSHNIRDFLFEEVQRALDLQTPRPTSAWPFLPAIGTQDVKEGANPRAICIHPGSGSIRKNWPILNYYSLISDLGPGGHSVLWSLGPADEALSETLYALLADKSETAVPIRNHGDWEAWSAAQVGPGKTAHGILRVDLAVLMGILRKCSFFIGNDSGVSHLSAALGVPTLTIFGGSDPIIWAPEGPARAVQWTGSAHRFPDLAEVRQLARKMMR